MVIVWCKVCDNVVDEVYRRSGHDTCRKCVAKEYRHKHYLENQVEILEKNTKYAKQKREEAKKEKKRKAKRALAARERRAREKEAAAKEVR